MSNHCDRLFSSFSPPLLFRFQSGGSDAGGEAGKAAKAGDKDVLRKALKAVSAQDMKHILAGLGGTLGGIADKEQLQDEVAKVGTTGSGGGRGRMK
jgi:hypothetical protein